MNLPFRVLFEDQHLIVLSKEPGLLAQGDSSGEVSLVDLLRTHFGRNYVGLIHRLDRNTSGLMVVAKRSKSADRLSEQLRTGNWSANTMPFFGDTSKIFVKPFGSISSRKTSGPMKSGSFEREPPAPKMRH